MSAALSHTELQALLAQVCPLVYSAGEVVLGIYQRPIQFSHKADQSPVTEADAQAEAVLVAGLQQIAPHLPVVAEEAVAAGGAVQTGERFWLVDPLDGTKEFIQRNGEFTVNVALIEHGKPVLGVVLAPALGSMYAGAHGLGAWVESQGQRQTIACRTAPPEGLTVVASRSHGDAAALDALLSGQTVAQFVQAGSSLKLCLVAEGKADLYPRLGRTMEWDIAAGHAVLAAAGGNVRCLDGVPLAYGKPGLDNPHFVARGLPA